MPWLEDDCTYDYTSDTFDPLIYDFRYTAGQAEVRITTSQTTENNDYLKFDCSYNNMEGYSIMSSTVLDDCIDLTIKFKRVVYDYDYFTDPVTY